MPAPEPIFHELEGLTVRLNRLLYQRLPATDAPEGKTHCFTYYLSICNGSDAEVSIRARKWVVAHDDGSWLVVEGLRVVGEQPRLAPGEQFSYHSRHLIQTRSAVVEGSFFGLTGEGRPVWVRVPQFHLTAPITPAGI